MAKEPENLPDMARLQNELTEAIKVKRDADHSLDVARRDQTAALNRLNDKQKAFDAGVKAMRDACLPVGGDWHKPEWVGTSK